MLSCNGQKDSNQFKTMPTNTTLKNVHSQTNPGQRFIDVALLYLGKPYLANSLEKDSIEQLIVDTSGFDCYTLIETVLAKSIHPNDIPTKIQQMRYRNGVITDYTSRIHYFSEWIYENQKNGLITDITPSFECAEPYPFYIQYMSSNPQKYKHLVNNPDYVPTIKKIEDKMNQLQFKFIPKETVKSCISKIKTGDIIAITTNIKGLDISHVGFAYWQKGKLKLLHASTDEKMVVVSDRPLEDYLSRNKKQTGIIVLRVN
jgi:cell wall-associated NlpC family hydrolase